MMLAKVVGGILAVSLANLAVVRLSGREPAMDAATREAMTNACEAALPKHSGSPSKAPLGVLRVEPLGAGHYWVTLQPEGGTGSRPVACDLVRDSESWRAESVTVIEW